MWKNPLVNGWPLFWLATLPMTGFLLWEASGADLTRPEDVSHMISYSVRWAVPFIYLALAASSMPVLFPGDFTRWWGRNRRYLGLVFAVAMTWQGAFIFTISAGHGDYYYGEIYLLRDELEGTSGYLFLAAMVLTSFQFGRKYVTNTQWKILHRCGVYFLWAYPFSVYWWNLNYYGYPQPIDYVFYWAGFLAFVVRIAAWGKKRMKRLQVQAPGGSQVTRPGGLLLVAMGLLGAASGNVWREATSAALLAPDWSATLELWLPFWPFEPFLPLVVIGIGTWLFTGAFRADEPVPQATH